MAFVAPGFEIEAYQLRALTADFDAILTMAFGGLSWLAFDLGAELPRAFTVYLGPIGTRFFFPGEPEYDHAPFTAWAAAAVVTEYDDDLELAKVDDPDIDWFLDGSLEAHTVDHVPTGGTESKPYWLAKYFDPLDGASFRLRERFRRWDTLDVVFDGGDYDGDAFTWPADWDKYHCLRFHNLRDAPLTIHLSGGHDVELVAFGIRAVRRDYPKVNAWRDAYRYIWEPISGDQLVWETCPPEAWTADTPRFSNLTSLSFFTRAITLLTTQPLLFHDPSRLWVTSSVSPYPPIDDARRVIDYVVAPGTLYSVRSASTAPVMDTLSWSTWAQLEAGIGDDGFGDPIIIAVPVSGGWDLEGIGTDHDVMGITSELFPALKPVTLPQTILRGASSPVTVDGAAIVTQTVEADWRPDPSDPPGDPDSYVTVSVDVDIFEPDLHGTDVGGDETFGDSKVWSTSGLVSRPSDLAYQWNNWELIARGEVEFDAAHAEAISTKALSTRLLPADLWTGGTTGQYGLEFHLPYQLTPIPMSPEIEVAPVRITRRLSAYGGFEDGFGAFIQSSHPDLDGDLGLPGGVEWEFDRKEITESLIARRGITAGAVATRSLPVRPLADAADRVLGLSPSSYASGRTAILAGTLTDTEKGQLVRIPITAEQYDIVSGLLASIVYVVPQTIDLSTWWDLGSGGSAVESIYLPSDFGRFADPVGRATILGLTVLTATDDTDVITYVTKADLASRAAALGWPYFASTLEVPVERNEFGFWIRGSGAWCIQGAQRILAAKWTREENATGPPPDFDPIVISYDVYPVTPGYPIQDTLVPSPAVRVVDVAALATAPTGWSTKRDTRLVTRPVQSIVYDSVDPIPASVVLDTIELLVQPAETDEVRAWLVTYIYAALETDLLTPADLSGLYEAAWDERSATLLTITPRTGYVRT